VAVISSSGMVVLCQAEAKARQANPVAAPKSIKRQRTHEKAINGLTWIRFQAQVCYIE
jgi:hypothetical protein